MINTNGSNIFTNNQICSQTISKPYEPFIPPSSLQSNKIITLNMKKHSASTNKNSNFILSIFKLNQFIFKPSKLITAFVIVFFFVINASCQCQKTILFEPSNQNYQTCQMCYFDFSEHPYFLKCQKKTNCTKIQNFNYNQNQNFNHAQDFNKNLSKNSNRKVGLPQTTQVCQAATSYVYDANQCQSLCCQSFILASSFQKQKQKFKITNQYCYDRFQSRQKSLILAILLTIVPVVCLMFCFVTQFFCKKNNSAQTLAANFGQAAQSYVDQDKIHLSKFQIQEKGPYHMKNDQNCSICLENCCNALTNCEHYYHPICLRQWLVKRPRCPICMSKNYNPIKIYCKHCRIGVKFEVFKRVALKQQQTKEITSLQQFLCVQCQRHPFTTVAKAQQKIVQALNKIIQTDQNQKGFQINRNEENISVIQFSQVLKSRHVNQNSIENQNIVQNQIQTISANQNQIVNHRKSFKFQSSVRQYINEFKKKKEKHHKKQEPIKQKISPFNQSQRDLSIEGTPQKLMFYQEDQQQQAGGNKISQESSENRDSQASQNNKLSQIAELRAKQIVYDKIKQQKQSVESQFILSQLILQLFEAEKKLKKCSHNNQSQDENQYEDRDDNKAGNKDKNENKGKDEDEDKDKNF